MASFIGDGGVVRGNRMRIHGGAETGDRHQHVLVVTADRNRQVRQIAALNFGADVGGVGLECGGGGFNRNGIGDGADLQREIDTGGIVGSYIDALLGTGPESFLSNLDVIAAGLNRDETIAARVVCYRITLLASLFISGGDGGPRNGGAARVIHRSDNGSVKNLRRRRIGEDSTEQGKKQAYTKRACHLYLQPLPDDWVLMI